MTDLGPSSLSPGSFEKTVGNYLVDGDQTYLDVMTDSCASTFSSYGFDHLDRLFTVDLQDPTEGSDSVVYEFNQHNSKNFTRLPVPGMEAPVWQLTVSAGRTWPSSTRTSLTASERELFTRQPWQTAFSGTSAQAKAINPGAVTATVEITGSNLSTNAAKLAFVQRYIYLFGGRRDLLTFTTEFRTELLDINLHSKVRVKMPRLGCSSGRLFRVVTIEWNLKARTATFGLWGGEAGPLDTALGAGTSAPGGGTGYTPPPTPRYVLDHFQQFAVGSVASSATAAAEGVLSEFAQFAYGTITNPAVWQLAGTSVWTLSNNDRTATVVSGGGVRTVRGSLARSTGKRYFEIVRVSGGFFGTSVRDEYGLSRNVIDGNQVSIDGIGYRRAGQVRAGGSILASPAPLGDGDVVQFAMDLDTGKVWVGRNGTWITGDPGAGTGEIGTITVGTYNPGANSESGSPATVTLNAATGQFSHSVPSGFIPWSQ
jgi:hypothetical protein